MSTPVAAPSTTYAKRARRHHGMMMRGLETFQGPESPATSGGFGRVFPKAGYNPTDAAVHELAQTMQEPNTPDKDSPQVPIGMTFLAQFVDHDLTLDVATLFGQQQDPKAVTF